MEKKKLTLIFKNVEKVHLGKDVFLVPYYLKKINNFDTTIVCPLTDTNKELENEVKGIKINKLNCSKLKKNSNKFYVKSKTIKYIIKNSRKIDVLASFHLHDGLLLLIFLYKIINPRGFVYIKSDAACRALPDIVKGSSIKWNIKKLLFNKVDVISIEDKKTFDETNAIPFFRNKIILVPNGFDEDELSKFDLPIKDFSEKDKLIITVGRLGSREKNTEMLLEAAKKIDLKDWKITLVGPIEKVEQDFQKTIDAFFVENPHLKDKILFTGNIDNKKDLWSYYNDSRVFVLTSPKEGFPIVFPEAYRFKNYIISTDVGGVNDIIHNGYGEVINSADELANSLQ